MVTLDEARAALRERQGAGARYDAATAPAEMLGMARLGTAYFARLLNDLPDDALDAPSLVPGWTRRHVIAQVGYQARALTRLTEWAASGRPQPMYASDAARRTEVEEGANLPTRALRGLFYHAAVHLDVEWRDLDDPAWDRPLSLPDGTPVTARDTAWLRAREIWLRAVDLDAGGSFLDMPPALIHRLIAEAVAAWAGPPMVLRPTDGEPHQTGPVGNEHETSPAGSEQQTGPAGSANKTSPAGTTISGRSADIARWLTGRGARRLTHDGPLPPVATPTR